MPAAYTGIPSVQVSDFEDNGLLIRYARLICDSCSSGQRFACGFLQIPPCGRHPCRPADNSSCRACRGLPPPSDRLHTICNQMVLAHHAPCRVHAKNGDIYYIYPRYLLLCQIFSGQSDIRMISRSIRPPLLKEFVMVRKNTVGNNLCYLAQLVEVLFFFR